MRVLLLTLMLVMIMVYVLLLVLVLLQVLVLVLLGTPFTNSRFWYFTRAPDSGVGLLTPWVTWPSCENERLDDCARFSGLILCWGLPALPGDGLPPYAGTASVSILRGGMSS